MNRKLNHDENGIGPEQRPNGAQPSKGTSRRKPQSAVLSPRQTEIAKLVAQGLSDKEIGNQLHLTEGTVGWYLNKIFLKCQVRSCVALTLRFLQEMPPKREPNMEP